MSFHDEEGVGSVHVPYNWEYADASARGGATGLVAADNGKFARQLDDNSIWLLTDYTGPAWVQVGSGAVPGDADKVIVKVRKGSAGSIPKGSAVYQSGWNASGWIEVELADSSDANKMPAIAVAEVAITNAATVDAIAYGRIGTLATSTFAVRDSLYISKDTPGSLVNVRPIGATTKIQKMGFVLRSDASLGEIFVSGANRSNDVPNIAEDKLWKGDSDGVAQEVTDVDAIPLATTSVQGLMSAADKEVLDELALGDVFINVRNNTGDVLIKGMIVYPSGWYATEDIPYVGKADKDDADKRPCIGVVREEIADGATGEAIVTGTLHDFNTSSWALTDQLVLGSNGLFSRPPPDEDPFTGEVQNVANVMRSHTTEGHLQISIDGMNAVTAAQIFAALGTDGTPSKANRYVTNSDSRNSDARTPTSHAASHVGADSIQDASNSQKGLSTAAQVTAQEAATTHSGSDGKSHSDVVLNNTHRGSDGKNHSDVVANNAKVTNANHTGDVTGDTALTIANDAVTNAKAANMAQATIKGRASGAGTGDPTDLSQSQLWGILDPESSKSISVESPSDSEDISMFFTNVAITVTEIRAVLKAAGSVTWTLRHATTRNATGTEVLSGGTVTNSITSGSDVTSFTGTNNEIPANSFVWLETTAQSGTPEELSLTVFSKVT